MAARRVMLAFALLLLLVPMVAGVVSETETIADSAGTAGGAIGVAPDGDVFGCHGKTSTPRFFRSDDEGATFFPSDRLLSSASGNACDVVAVTSNLLYAATLQGTISRSNNAGIDWLSFGNTFPSMGTMGTVTGVAIAAHDANRIAVVFVNSAGSMYAYTTTDAATTWTGPTALGGNGAAGSVDVAKGNANTDYGAVSGGRFAFTTNSGTSWSNFLPISSPGTMMDVLPDVSGYVAVGTVVGVFAGATDPAICYLGTTSAASYCNHFYYSVPGGTAANVRMGLSPGRTEGAATWAETGTGSCACTMVSFLVGAGPTTEGGLNPLEGAWSDPQPLTSLGTTPARAVTANDDGIAFLTYFESGTGVKVLRVENQEITADATAVVAGGIAGMSVDVTGSQVILVRTGTGSVQTHVPFTLNVMAGPEATGCGASPALDALPTHVAYTYCDPASDVDQIRIRSPQLTSPNFNGCSACVQNIEDGFLSSIDVPDNILRMKTLTQYPYTFEGDGDCNVGGCRLVAFPFTEFNGGSSPGIWGMYVAQFRSVNDQQDATEFIQFGPTGSTPDDLCSWRSSATDEDLVGVAQYQAGLKVYRFEIDGSSLGDPDLSVFDHRSGPTFLARAQSIDCGGNLIAGIGSDGKIGAFYVDTDDEGHTAGQVAWQRTLAGANIAGGLTMSAETTFIAYVEGDLIMVADARTGEVLGNVTKPDGVFKGIEFDRVATNLFYASDTTLYRYNLSCFTNNCTDRIDTNTNPFDSGLGSGNQTLGGNSGTGPNGGTLVEGGNFFVSDGTELPKGMTELALNTLLGVLLMIALAAGMYALFDKSNLGAGIGGVGGFVMAWGFDLFEDWIPLFIVLVTAAIVVLWFARGR